MQGLPYGTYLVVETTVPHDLFQAEPFIVTVDPEQDNNPWGAMATPKDSVMTGSDSYQKFTVLDEEIEVYLRITKVDEETGKPVLLPDTAFQIYWLDEQGHYRYDSNGNPKLVTMTDTVNGHLTKDVDTFYTNSEGNLTLPEKLPLGKYRIVEVTGPNGFYNEWKDTAGYENGILADDADGSWDAQLNDVVMATSIAKYDGAASSQSFEVVRSKDANADFIEQQTLKFYNDREKAKVGVYKVDRETGKYLAGAVFNLYTADDIYSVDGKLLFAAGELVATSPETGADGYTYFDCDIPIRGEYYGSSIRKDATTNSGNYIVKELRAPLGYYVNEEPMEVTFTYDGQATMVLDNTCANKPTEMWVSKRDLTNDEELPGATLAIKDMDGNTVTTWVSTDEPHRVTGLHFGESYTLTEIRAADGYALTDNITFRLIQKSDEDGNPLEECEVYYLTTKNILFWKWDDWKLLDDATVIMQDDITKVQISKKDLTTNEELPGAELIITDEKGSEIDRWISTDAPHYMEKLPAGKYTLTEVTAPDGYAIAERMLSGFPLSGRCTIQRDCKLPPIKAYQKALPPDTVQYIGIAADEPKRLARLKPGQISLLDKYHVAEPEARSMCAAEGLLSPLYDFTKRGGCWFCPNASISELRHLYRYHPELWQLLLELQDVPNKPTERFSWRRTFREIDERFRQEGEQLSFYEER